MDIRVAAYDGPVRPFVEAVETAFGEHLREEDAALFEPLIEPGRTIAATDDGRIVGTAAILSFELTVPGAMLPTAGVSMVGVHPTHRRRGILRRMMRLQLDGVHERGEPLAALWASEGSIYQRFGYGLSTLRARFAIDRDRSAFRRPHAPTGTIRMVDVDEAKHLFPPAFDAVRPRIPGFFSRSSAFWETEIFADPEHWRRGAGQAWHIVHERDGAVDGYARYRIKDEWEDRGPKSQLIINELIADGADAHLDLWTYLLGVDLIGRIEAWNVAPDDPLLLTVAEPRRLGMALGDALWLRVIDAAAALSGRRYAQDGRVVLELTDEFCPWNAGRWQLTVEDGVPRVEATPEDADLALDATDLAAAYLGAFTFAALAAARRVTELDPGGVARADALFRADRAPWCPRVF